MTSTASTNKSIEAETDLILARNHIIRGKIDESLLKEIQNAVKRVHQSDKSNVWKRAITLKLQARQRTILKIKQKQASTKLKNDPWINELKHLYNNKNDELFAETNLLFNVSLRKSIIKQLKCNVLFLDVDGVLNDCHLSQYLLEKQMRLLLELMRDPEIENLKIVISSSWRETVNDLYQMLTAFMLVGINIRENIIGCTPINSNRQLRSQEIYQWLELIQSSDYQQLICVENYVILDDLWLEGKHIEGHFVRTSVECGLSTENILQVKQIFLKQRKNEKDSN